MVSAVYFYIPNLIGYSRIILAALSFVYIHDYVAFFTFYTLSAALDIADGHAARAFNQCSKFGSILDMVTDRASTSCLIVVLANFYPKYTLHFQFLIAIDIISHFAHIFSSLSRGATSHKIISKEQNIFLRIYYTNRLVLGFLCGGNEAFFILAYLLHFWTGPMLPLGPLAPVAAAFGWASSEMELVRIVLFFAAFPIMCIKQFMNIVQLRQAAVDLVEMDEKDRKKH